MALQIEISLNPRDRALFSDMAASLKTAACAVSNLEKTVSAATDAFNANFAKFQTDFSQLSTDISAAITALQSGINSGDDAAIQAAADQLATIDSQATDLDSKLKAATPAAAGSPSSSSASGSQSGSSGSAPIA